MISRCSFSPVSVTLGPTVLCLLRWPSQTSKTLVDPAGFCLKRCRGFVRRIIYRMSRRDEANREGTLYCSKISRNDGCSCPHHASWSIRRREEMYLTRFPVAAWKRNENMQNGTYRIVEGPSGYCQSFYLSVETD